MNTADRLLIKGPDHSYNLVSMVDTWAKNQSTCKSGKELEFFLNSLSAKIWNTHGVTTAILRGIGFLPM